MQQASNINIIQCDDNHSRQWDDFLLKSEYSSLYHVYAWKEIYEKCFGHQTFYLAAIENGNFQGVLPLVYIKSKVFGKILCSIPFLNYGGPCTLYNQVEELLFNEACSIVDKYKMDYLEIRGARKINLNIPTSKNKVSLTINLDTSPETLWNNFKSKHRTNIRRAYKNNISVKSGGLELLDIFYKILSESWRDHGTPLYNKSYFHNILAEFDDRIRIYIAFHNDIPIATAFNGHYKDTIEGMWAGGKAEYRKLQPNHVLYWEMIKDGCENGFKVFHLGRSSADSTSETFKKRWNAIPTQLYWQYYLGNAKEIPQLNVNNPKFELAIKIWRNLPLKVTSLIGPMLANKIP